MPEREGGAVPEVLCPADAPKSELEGFLDEIRDMSCAPLFTILVRAVAALDADAEVRPLGVHFRRHGVTLCEFSFFGELFIARVGPGLAVEYRVRHEEVALLALDHVLRTYVELRNAPPNETTQPES